VRGFDTKTAWWAVITGVLVTVGALLVLWGVAALLILTRENASYACSNLANFPPPAGVPREAPYTLGEYTSFPIGLECSYAAELDLTGPEATRVVRQTDWPNTLVACAGLVLMLVSPAVLLWAYLRDTR
jgi:hypothetical protein